MADGGARPCCLVGARVEGDALLALNAALVAAASGAHGVESLNAIHLRTGLRKEALIGHRKRCLAGYVPPENAATPARSAEANRTPNQSGPGGVARDLILESPEGGPAEALIADCADIVFVAGWQGHATVKGLAIRHKTTTADVRTAHVIGSARVAAARGSRVAQVETAIARYQRIWGTEMTNADTYDGEVKAADLAGDKPRAKLHRRLASMARTVALAAQRHIDAITIARPQAMTVHVALQTDADFAEVWDLLRMVLTPLYPGATADLQAMLGAYEDGGRAGVEAWLAERLAKLRQGDVAQLLTAGEDGTYGGELQNGAPIG